MQPYPNPPADPRDSDLIAPVFSFDFAHEEAPEQSAPTPAPGDVIAGWKVIRLIAPAASEASAAVFEVVGQLPSQDSAADPHTPIRGAMKLFGSRASMRRFRLHASILTDVRHPGLVRVLDWGVLPSGFPFLVMELVQGQTFDRWLADSRPSVTSIVDVLSQAAFAIGSAHSQLGLVHRDLKPSNLMVEPVSQDGKVQPRARVIDFGVALLIREADAPTDSLATGGGTIVGTPGYMAPEQFYAGSRTVDARADVYALGVMLFEALTGRRPVETNGLSIVETAQRKQSVRISARAVARLASPDRGPIPRRVASVIAAALLPDPADRPSDAIAFAEELLRASRGQPPLHKPPGIFRRTRRFLAREPRVAAGLGALAIGGTISIIAIGAFAIRAESARRAEQAQTDRLVAMVKSWTQGAFLRSFQTPGSEAAMIAVTESVIKALEEASSVRPNDIDLLDQLSLAYAQLASVVGTPIARSLGDEARARALHDLSIDAATKSAALYRVQRPAEADLARLSIANAIKRRVSVTPDVAERRVLLARAMEISEEVYALLPTRDDVVMGHVGTLGLSAEVEPDPGKRLALLDRAERLLIKQLETTKRAAPFRHQLMILRLTIAGELAKSDPKRAARELATARELLAERIKTLAPETQTPIGPPLDPKVPVQAMLSRLLARTMMLEAQIAAAEGRWEDALRLSDRATQATESLMRGDPTSGPSAFDHATRLRERAELLLEAGSRSDLGTEERAELRGAASAAAREAIRVIESFMPERPRTYVEKAEIERCRGVLGLEEPPKRPIEPP